ncbi:cobalt-precorrin 5A acetaldehyde-lyase [Anaerobacterium chartisolvens]|uniref:Cobalt-precorrin 5A acetaldehyde-lyase n=1 Tax=Anaerobacterium chartisolvens TaxID=1297424 RepID=A0A369B8D6_9FIRM|nr:cobalt-precorrin 5A hydrolase [Anaerobacterium chartisolvens]RCX17575.1 cobalt-precorrin 5A acetaldehyde-lyase [Anaerobacterium chartisolvens]
MKCAVVALTPNGARLALTVSRQLGACAFIKSGLLPFIQDEGSQNIEVRMIEGDFKAFTGYLFRHYDGLVFIMACGIVVRSIAPYIIDKARDPAVVVMDEKCRYAISLLSGHVGGANMLARRLSEETGAVPVITTATDINGLISLDAFAVQNDCAIENTEQLKPISAALLRGEQVSMYSEYTLKGDFPSCIKMYKPGGGEYPSNMVVLSSRTDIEARGERTLYIRPRSLVLGAGCKKGTTREAFKEAVRAFMNRNKRSMLSLKCLATIELKKNEGCLEEFCRDNGLEMKVIPNSDIAQIEDEFHGSEFVREKTGVAGVAEPCARLACRSGELICGKTVYSGITLALCREEREYLI